MAQTAPALRELAVPWRAQRQTIALVPTMGNLHRGHIDLCRRARARAERVIVTVFVNPTQFGPGEDYASYPRTLDADVAALQESGCADAVFVPDVGEIYPHGTQHAVGVALPALSRELCGASRPGHFDGVAGVVLRLVNLTQPAVLVLGEKDYQQLVLIKWLAVDLHLDLEVLGMPISRAADGLALSSRNRYLSGAERKCAPALHRELDAIGAAIRGGALEFDALASNAARVLEDTGFSVDYIEVRTAGDLRRPGPADPANELIVLGAARIGAARLIDNVRV